MKSKVVVRSIGDHLVVLDHINEDRLFMAKGRCSGQYFVLTSREHGFFWHHFSRVNESQPNSVANRNTLHQTVKGAIERALDLDWEVHEIDTAFFLRSR